MNTEKNEANHQIEEFETENTVKESAIARLEERIAELERQIREDKEGRKNY